VIEVQTLITYIDLKEALEKRKAFACEEHPSHKAVWNILGNLAEIQGEVLHLMGTELIRTTSGWKSCSPSSCWPWTPSTHKEKRSVRLPGNRR